MESKLEEYGPGGMVPEYGAIFMANRDTKKECLKMEVFGLPSGSANFVKQVKAGMLLFLFEYEKRQLFGVYRAITDGGINILSQGSSLTQYPAQVRFTPVWFCDPLSEKEFQDAIKENYFAVRKFHFGLSKDQVHKLLQLFSTRKLKNELQPKQLRGGSEPSHDLRHKLRKKFIAGDLEGRNGSPDLSIKDIGDFADRFKEEDNSYQYMVNVTNNRHNTNTSGQSGLPDNFSGSLSSKRRKEEDDRNLMDLRDQRSVHHEDPGLNLFGQYSGDTLDGNKRTKEEDDRYFVKLKDQRSVHQDVPDIPFSGEYHGDTLNSYKRRTEEDDRYLMSLKGQQSVYHNVPDPNFCGEYRRDTSESKKRKNEDDETYLMNLKDQQSAHHDGSATNFCGEYHHDTLDSNTLENNNRRKEDDDRYFMNLKDQGSLHHNVCGEHNGDTLDTSKRRMEDDDKYLMNVTGQRYIYHDVSTSNFGVEYRGDIFGKHRQPSDCDELLLHGNVHYEDKDNTLRVDKYLPVPSKLRIAGNDMYTFVDRVVADSELGVRPSSNSPHMCRETLAFCPKGLSDHKFLMNLGSKRTYESCNSHQDVLLSEVNGDTKCSKPEFRYPLNDAQCSTQHMQNMDHLHRPDIYMNSASVDELNYRPHKNTQFESKHYQGASLEHVYSSGKFDENIGNRVVTGDGFGPFRDGRVKGSGEPILFSELHSNSSQSYIPNRTFDDSRFTRHIQDEGSAAMDYFHNSITSFGYGASCQPSEDLLMYPEGSPSRKKNQLSEAEHLIYTYPSYHESLVTKSIPCDSDVNFSHPDPSSSLGVFSSSSLLRGIPPYHDSGEPRVSNSRSLLYHPEESRLSKFPCIDSKNKDKVQCSSSANQDYYLGGTNNCFQNTEAAENRELENTLPTNCRSHLFATSPSANRRFPEDAVCSKEKIWHHASSPHKNLSVNYFDSVHPSSSRVFEHVRDKSSACQFPDVNWSSAAYLGCKDLTNYDSEPYTSQGQVMGPGNDNAEHPLDVSGIPRSKRRSVFARLSSGPEISSLEKLDADRSFSANITADEVMDKLRQDMNSQLKKQGKGKSQKLVKHDEEKLNNDQMLKADASVDEVMGMLPQGKKSLVKKPGESTKLATQPDEEVSKTKKNFSHERPVDHGHLIDSPGQDNSKICSEKLTSYANLADGECPDGTLRETRLVQFKRRSETKKILDESIGKRNDKAVDKRAAIEGSMGNKTVDNRTAGNSTKSTPFKRRKLIRPVFGENESAAEGMEAKPEAQVIRPVFVENELVAEGMEARPEMHDPAQSPVKDTQCP